MKNSLRVGLAVEYFTDQLASTCQGNGVDFIEYGIKVANGIPKWFDRAITPGNTPLNLHPLDLNLGGDEPLDEAWCRQLSHLTKSMGVRALVTDAFFWYHGKRGSTWPRPIDLARSALVCRQTAARVADYCGVPFRIENPPVEWMPGEVCIWRFLDQATEDENLEICLDLAHLIQLERNLHGRDPVLPLDFPWERVREIHLAGFVAVDYLGKRLYLDQHEADIDELQRSILLRVIDNIGPLAELDICLEMEARSPSALLAAIHTTRSLIGIQV